MASIVSALKFPSLTFGSRHANEANASAQTEDARGPHFTLHGGIGRLANKEASPFAWRVPFIHKLPLSRQIQALSLGAAILLILAVVAFAISAWDTRVRREQALVSTDLQLVSQQIATLAHQATSGDANAFNQLDEARRRLVADLTVLSQGGEHNGIALPAASEKEVAMLRGIAETWKAIDEQVAKISPQQQNLLQLRKHEEVVAKSGAKILGLTQQILSGSISRGEEYRATAWTTQLYADILNFDLLDAKSLVSTDQPNPQVALQLTSNVASFLRTVKGLVDGNPETGISALHHPVNRDTAAELLSAVTELKSGVESIVKNMQGLAQAKQAARDSSKNTQDLLGELATLTSAYREAGAGWGTATAGMILAMLTLAGLSLVAKVLLEDVRARGARTEEENRRNEHAILRLLDDMSDLAEGDLTKHAQVTEDMTGAIADSVNHAIDELRSLVTQINAAAGQLSESSSQGRAVSSHLLQVADRQSNQIQEAAASVLQIASTMDTVSESASQCAEVADQSISASGKGSSAVQDSISGMNMLREQIQETSKRIKRLGESSQEIGEIVQLISGITEQTNVLALNAAIQAATAGEAGRGFTVVAEEVQRLAERSAEATKQIGAIVKTIQNDTQDAVSAMEKSTQGVVQGAQLADSAGRALDEIREVSNRLAELIASISSSTQSQQQVAKHLARRMQEILGITMQSSKGTRWTAESMAQISDLAQKLRISVSGFKV